MIWLLTVLKIAVIGVIAYSICEVTHNRTMALLVKLMAVLMVIQIALTAATGPIKAISKPMKNIGTILDRWANGKPAEYNPQQQISPLNPLPDNQIPIWRFGPSGQPQSK